MRSISWKSLFYISIQQSPWQSADKNHFYFWRECPIAWKLCTTRENGLLEHILALELVDQISKCFLVRVFSRISADMRHFSYYCSSFSGHLVRGIPQILLWAIIFSINFEIELGPRVVLLKSYGDLTHFSKKKFAPGSTIRAITLVMAQDYARR